MTNDDNRSLQIKAAQLYYEQNMTQAEVAKAMELSMPQVQRLLVKARKSGIVEITVHSDARTFSETEILIQKKYGLKGVKIFQTGDYESFSVHTRISAEAGAEYLRNLVRSGDRLVVTWELLMLRMVQALRQWPRPKVKDVKVLQSFGGHGGSDCMTRTSLIKQHLAKYLGAQEGDTIYAPLIAGSAEAARVFRDDSTVAPVIEEARNANIFITGLGDVRKKNFRNPPHPFADADRLGDRGAVGNINLRFFDAEGQAVRSDFDDRLVGLTLDEIRNIDTVLCMAGGAKKWEPIKAALAGKLIDILITDHVTAGKLLE